MLSDIRSRYVKKEKSEVVKIDTIQGIFDTIQKFPDDGRYNSKKIGMEMIWFKWPQMKIDMNHISMIWFIKAKHKTRELKWYDSELLLLLFCFPDKLPISLLLT